MTQNIAKSQFAEDIVQEDAVLSEIRKEFAERLYDLIPILQRVQKTLGHLPERVLLEIAHLTRLPPAKVFGVASFYAQFRFQPVGKFVIRVCRGTACHVRGSGRILKDIQGQLQVAPGETTKDRLFSLETVACFGSCALAPVIMVNDSVRGRMNPAKAQEMQKELREEAERCSKLPQGSQGGNSGLFSDKGQGR